MQRLHSRGRSGCVDTHAVLPQLSKFVPFSPVRFSAVRKTSAGAEQWELDFGTPRHRETARETTSPVAQKHLVSSLTALLVMSRIRWEARRDGDGDDCSRGEWAAQALRWDSRRGRDWDHQDRSRPCLIDLPTSLGGGLGYGETLRLHPIFVV